MSVPSAPADRAATISAVSLPRALAGLGVVLLVTALLPASIGKALLLLLLGGIAPLIVLRRDWTLVSLACAAPVAALPLWSLATFIAFAVGGRGALAFWPAAVALVLALVARRRNQRLALHLDARDGWALGIALLASIPVGIVFAANGGQPDGSYVAHAWWGRDSFYFFSLVQMALARGAYPLENPFVASAPNLYLSAAHLGFAGLCEQSGAIAARSVPRLGLALLFASFGLVFLALSKHASAPAGQRRLVVPAVATLLWLGFRPDLFLCPQTQGTVFGAFALVLLLHGEDNRPGERALVAGLCLYLAFAHAVTAAVVTVYLAASAVHALGRGKRARFRWQAALALLLALLYLVLNRPPYPSARGGFAWANLGAGAVHFVPWILPSLSVAAVAVFAWRRRLPWLLPVGALGLGLAYYGFGMTLADPGHRWFVTFNAERFPHYALLVAFASLPLLSRTAGLVSLTVALLGLVLHPPALVAASTQLVTDKPLRVSARVLGVLDEVRTRTPPEARVLVLARSYSLAAFTGRAQAPIESFEMWAMNALPAGEVARRQQEWATFAAVAPAERERVLAVRGYTHLVLQVPDGAEPVAFVQALLPSRQPRLVAAAGDVALLALPAP